VHDEQPETLETIQARHAAETEAFRIRSKATWERSLALTRALDAVSLSRTTDPETHYFAKLAMGSAHAEGYRLVRHAHSEGPPMAAPVYNERKPGDYVGQLAQLGELTLIGPDQHPPRGTRVVGDLATLSKAGEAYARRIGTQRAAAEALETLDHEPTDDALLQLGRSAEGRVRLKDGTVVLTEGPADVNAETARKLDGMLGVFPEDLRKMAKAAALKAAASGDLTPLDRVVVHLTTVTDPMGRPVPWCRLFPWSPGDVLPEGRAVPLSRLWVAAKARAALASVYGEERSALLWAENALTGIRGGDGE
jgi:hypothetical protein